MKPHKHAELIKAWADGAEIEVKNEDGTWEPTKPLWHPNNVYRIKPEEKKPVVRWLWAVMGENDRWYPSDFFLTEGEAINRFTWGKIKKLEYTRTEFEE